ncbi:hypothetical protein ACQ0P8_06560 [Halodesulfovibrio aestuarii]|uniref:DUF4875 domain-containing protein n=1 Tax=Halodesulfovibrio aestuarii TaxID=126333 RepID=A0A8G2FJB0_9BACT|nr:hypothetical protein [Halodesulfovibrio aestuarii]SHJ76052.1 hypothetical protein SAMN05660830_03160 [Halodesulfovibrio aestuarii]
MNRFHKLINYAIVIIVVGFVAAAFLWDNKKEPDMSQAVKYEVIDVLNSSVTSRGRAIMEIRIPEFQNYNPEQYAHTAMKAAEVSIEKLRKKYPEENYQALFVRVMAAKDEMIATALYAIDNKGWDGTTGVEWKVETLDGKLPPVEYFQTSDLWIEMRKDYQIPDPVSEGSTMTDEDALRSAIAEQLHIPFDMVHLPIFSLSEYLRK